MEIDEREQKELLDRWQKCQADADTNAMGISIAELIEEACRGVSVGRISSERCSKAGDAVGREWRASGRDLAMLADEFAALRRSLWDAVANRLKTEKALFDAVMEARAMIDLAFDIALRKALGAMSPDAQAESRPERRSLPEPTHSSAGQGDFYRELDGAIDTAAHSMPVALLVLHIDVLSSGIDALGIGADTTDVSEIVRAQLRARDVPFAITDCDFVVVCTRTGAAGAKALVERVTSALTMFGARACAQIEVTAGFAVAPEDGATSLDLIRVALADREFSLPGAAEISPT